MSILVVFLLFLFKITFSKYIEGEIHTKEDWIFLARFCFLSHQGLFEYHIEFNEDMGDPNLLLYYDTDDQWPAVYKTQKTCLEKEAVVHLGQNQVINLTASIPNYRTSAGCFYMNDKITSTGKTFTITLPTLQPLSTKTKRVSTAKIETTTTPATQKTPKREIFTTTTSADMYDTESSTWSTEIDYFPSTTETEENLKSQYEIFNATVGGAPMISNNEKIIKRSVPNIQTNTKLNVRRGRKIVCQNARSFSSSRERWWFIALSNCKNNKGIHVKYKILMTNGPPGDYWHEHLSADEFYILPVLAAFSIAYTILLLGVVVCAIELKTRQLLHTTYRIFFVSIILQLFGIMIQTIAYSKYAMSGSDISRIKRSGSIFMGASETCFLLLLLLLAKGYTITRGRLPVSCSIKLTIFMCAYTATYIAIFIYESVVFDPGEVLYLFESPAGYALIILRIFAWCMFIYSTVFTLKHYPEKGNFYYPFNICGTMWFVAGPSFVLLGNNYIDKWVRESVVCAILLLIAFGGHLSFLILTMPSIANKNFPYHVRTTQIGVMQVETQNENFAHHPYEPTCMATTSSSEQTVIVPLTRRTEEIYEGMYNHRTYSGSGMKPDRIVNSEQQRENYENAMENVLSWSLAKNLQEIEYPQFAGSKRDSLASSTSKLSDGHHSGQNGQNGSLKGFTDYLQEVPVELFTISRMVLNKNNSNSNSTNNVQNSNE